MSGEFEQVFQRMADRAMQKPKARNIYLDLDKMRAHFGLRWFTTEQCAKFLGKSGNNTYQSLDWRVATGVIQVQRAGQSKPNRWRLTPKG